MKKIFTLLMALALVGVGAVHAAITPAANQRWWGYGVGAASNGSIGVEKADTYHAAIYLPGDHDVLSGKTLSAIRFGLVAPHATDVKVWVAASLVNEAPTAANTLWMADVATSDLSTQIDVPLTTPMAIPATGLYVGYSFTISSAETKDDQFPILMNVSDPSVGFLRVENLIPEWYNLVTSEYGALTIQVLVEGDFFANMVSPTMLTTSCYAEIGQSADVTFSLYNGGEAAVSNISYTIATDGVAGEEKTLTFDTPIPSYKSATVTIPVEADAALGSTTKTITVTKVNGEANASKNAAASFTFLTVDHLIVRNVVVEELTGTGCPNCPRGFAGMELLRETFGDRFIGIAVHQYNETDAMYLPAYPNVGFTAAPQCLINRGERIDPFYGTSDDSNLQPGYICNDFRIAMNEPTFVGVDVQGVMNDEETEVAITAAVEPLFDTDNYELELVLVADGLYGSTTAWQQTNTYASMSPSALMEGLEDFCRGGQYGTNPIRGYKFNDVAIATCYANGYNQVEALGTMTGGEKRYVNYTMAMPTKAAIRGALRKSSVQIYAVAIVVDKTTGRIANAAKRLLGETLAVSAVRDQRSSEAVARYSLDGMQLSAPQHGINIVRMADGSVRKVVVK